MIATYRKKRSLIVTVAAVALVTATIVTFRATDSPALPAMLAIGIIGATIFFLGRARKPVEDFKRHIKINFGQRVLSHYGENMELYTHGISESMFRLALGSVAPNYDRYRSEDLITGTMHGTDFSFYELELKVKRRSKNSRTTYVTVFSGYVLSMHLNRHFQGNIRITSDSAISRLFSNDRVRLESPEFEKHFDVYSDDQIGSRTILTPTFMEKLTQLALNPRLIGDHSPSAKRLNRAAFICTINNDYINLMVNSKGNRFEVEDNGSQIRLTTFAHTIGKEMQLISHCINELTHRDNEHKGSEH